MSKSQYSSSFVAVRFALAAVIGTTLLAFAAFGTIAESSPGGRSFVAALRAVLGISGHTRLQVNGKMPKSEKDHPIAKINYLIDGSGSLLHMGPFATKSWSILGSDFNTAGNWGGGVPSGSNVALFSSPMIVQPNLSSSLSTSGFLFSNSAASGYDVTSSSTAVAFTLTGAANTNCVSGLSDSSASAICNNVQSGNTNTIDAPLVLGNNSGTNTNISTFDQSDTGILVVNGTISETGAAKTLNLRGSSSGLIKINGNNNYSGGTSMATVTVEAGNDSSFGSGTLTLNSGTLQSGGGSRTLTVPVVLGGNSTIGGANNLNLNGTFTNSGSNRTLTVNNSGTTSFGSSVYLSEASGTGRTLTITGSGNVTFGGTIANFNGSGTAGNLTFNTSYTGTATLSNANTYSGNTTLSASSSSFVLGNKASFGTGTAALNGVGISSNTDLSGSNALTNTVTLGGNNTFSGSNNLEFSGPVTETSSRIVTNNVSGGILKFSGAFGLSSTATTNTITFDGTGNTSVSGVVANNGGAGTAASGNLIKTGNGSLTLSNTCTYSGTTTVNAGTLLVTGSTASGSAVTVNGGTLGGTGTVNGSVTVTSGTVAPGSSPGILNTGNISFASGSTYAVEIGGTTAGNASNNHDQLNVTGTVNLGSATLSLSSFNGFVPGAGQTFTIINNDDTDAITGIFNGLAEGATITTNFLGSGLTAKISYAGGSNSNDGVITTFDVTAPAAPSITGSTPTSPGMSTTPTIDGTAEASSTVKLYTASDCTGGIAGMGTATGGNFAIGVTVGANSTTTFYATATDASSNVSACSTGFSYTSDTIAPSLSYTPLDNTTSTSAIPLAVTSSDSVSMGTVSVFYSINGGSFTSAGCTAGTPPA